MNILEVYSTKQIAQFAIEEEEAAINYLKQQNILVQEAAEQMALPYRDTYIAESSVQLRSVTLDSSIEIKPPNYEQLLDDLDLPPIGNGLYAELISDKRYSIYGVELALTVAQQAEGIYSLCRSALIEPLNEKDIRNLQFRFDSIFYMLSDEKKAMLKDVIDKNNIPITLFI
jgi:hypothetical protein